MPKVDRDQYKKEAKKSGKKGGGKFLKWKDDGETIGYVHPTIGLWYRMSHGAIPTLEEDDKGNSKSFIRRVNCHATKMEQIPYGGCPVCMLQKFAKDKIENGFDGDETILMTGKGKNTFALDLSDVAGNGGYKTNPKPKKEICFAWILGEPDMSDDMENAIEIVTGPQTLGTKILTEIAEQRDEHGSIKGDVEIDPDFELKMKKGELYVVTEDKEIKWDSYPIQLKFDAEASSGFDMYKARAKGSKSCPLTMDIKQVMMASEEELGVDFEKLTNPTDVDKQMDYIKSSWESSSITFEEFDEYFRRKGRTQSRSKSDDVSDDEKKKPSENKSEVKKSVKKEIKKANYCPTCDDEYDDGSKFCQDCGYKLIVKPDKDKNDKKSKSDEQDKKKKEDTDDDDSGDSGESKESKHLVKCPICENMVEPMKPSLRCPECGEKIPDSDIPF